jgi:hypothetical protein
MSSTFVHAVDTWTVMATLMRECSDEITGVNVRCFVPLGKSGILYQGSIERSDIDEELGSLSSFGGNDDLIEDIFASEPELVEDENNKHCMDAIYTLSIGRMKKEFLVGLTVEDIDVEDSSSLRSELSAVLIMMSKHRAAARTMLKEARAEIAALKKKLSEAKSQQDPTHLDDRPRKAAHT